MRGLSWFGAGVAGLSLISVLVAPRLVPAQAVDVTPSRILLSWAGDPATTAAVTWRTEGRPATAVAQIAVASADPKFVSTAKDQAAASQSVELAEGGTAHYHTAAFTGLKPETRYSYRVGDGTVWSEWIDFTTASATPKPFTFIYLGDAQNNIKSMWSRVIRQAHRDAPDATFMLHAGDLVNRADSDKEWGEWFEGGGWLHASIPSVVAAGNHEYASGKLSRLWQPQFQYPRNGVAGIEETNYYVDYQGARIIALNSNEKREEQAAWLDRVLAQNKQKWTILTFHHPMYSTAQGRDNKALRELWNPIINKHKVDLVLQGHDHTYGRRNLPYGQSTATGGTVYVVSVSGPKMYQLGPDARTTMQKTAENTQLYQVIKVSGDALDYEARTATGELYDAFSVKKSPTGNVITPRR